MKNYWYFWNQLKKIEKKWKTNHRQSASCWNLLIPITNNWQLANNIPITNNWQLANNGCANCQSPNHHQPPAGCPNCTKTSHRHNTRSAVSCSNLHISQSTKIGNWLITGVPMHANRPMTSIAMGPPEGDLGVANFPLCLASLLVINKGCFNFNPEQSGELLRLTKHRVNRPYKKRPYSHTMVYSCAEVCTAHRYILVYSCVGVHAPCCFSLVHIYSCVEVLAMPAWHVSWHACYMLVCSCVAARTAPAWWMCIVASKSGLCQLCISIQRRLMANFAAALFFGVLI